MFEGQLNEKLRSEGAYTPMRFVFYHAVSTCIYFIIQVHGKMQTAFGVATPRHPYPTYRHILGGA
jgi:hypothetical protein